MRDQEEALSRASATLSRLGIPSDLEELRAAGIAVQRSTIGGSHSTVTYPPLDSLQAVDASALLPALRFGKTANLYVHIAFCETQCTFCHYAVKHYRGEAHSNEAKRASVRSYLDALMREMREWSTRLREAGTCISSIYIGGGTPLVLSSGHLEELFRTLRREFTILPNAEICFEGSPLTITAPDGQEKLRWLARAGVTRLSFGVQSFDNEVLRLAARGHQGETAIQACSIVGDIFPNWNVDLIQGLCQGSTDETWGNLEAIGAIRPPHLTWYHGRFADRPQGDWLRLETKRSRFEDEKATLLGRMLIWQEMAARGYGQIDGNRFIRDPSFADPFKKVRTSVRSDLLGLGVSAYSHVSSGDANAPEGWFFRNIVDINAYVETTLQGGNPIGNARALTPEELLAASYVIGLRTGRSEDAQCMEIRQMRPDLAAHYAGLEARLLSLGILETAGDGILRLSQRGQLFEDEVLSLFYSPTVQRALRS